MDDRVSHAASAAPPPVPTSTSAAGPGGAAVSSLFIPRSHRNNPAGSSIHAPLGSQTSTKQLIDRHAHLVHVLGTAAAHLPAVSRVKLEREAHRLEAELRTRSRSGGGARSTLASTSTVTRLGEVEEVNGWVMVAHERARVDQLGHAVAKMDIKEDHHRDASQRDHGPGSSLSSVSPQQPLRNMTLRQQLAQGLIPAGPAMTQAPLLNNSNQRRTSHQGPIVLLEPSSSSLAEAEALQAADYFRHQEAQRAAPRLQQPRPGPSLPKEMSPQAGPSTERRVDAREMNHPSWSFYTPDGLFGDDDGGRDEDDEDDAHSARLAGSMESSGMMPMSLSQSSQLTSASHNYASHRKVPRRIGRSGQREDGELDNDDDDEDMLMICDISPSEQHALEAAQEAEAALDAEQPGRWAYEAVAAREAAAAALASARTRTSTSATAGDLGGV